MLTPVDNPRAYGLVETDADSNIRRFLEKPEEDQITCDTINAGIYILEPDTFDRIPADTPWSIERSYFPSLIERGETFVAYVYRGYWIDIGTPEKYVQVHHDIMDGRYQAAPFAGTNSGICVAPTARVETGARLEGPCFIDADTVIKAGALIGPYSVVGPALSRRGARHGRAVDRLGRHAHRPGGRRPPVDPRSPLPCRAERDRREHRARRQIPDHRLQPVVT